MIWWSYLIPVVFLIVLSIVDLRTFNLREGSIPSAITTTFMITSFVIALNPITAIVALLVALLAVDLDLFAGMPDLKCVVACGMVMPNLNLVIIFATLVAFLAIPYKLILKRTKHKEIPFIPVIMVAYLIMVGVMLLR